MNNEISDNNINETTELFFILNKFKIEYSSLISNVKTYFENLDYIVYFFWGSEQICENVISINNNKIEKEKKYIIFLHHDYEYNINVPDNVFIFRSSVLKSKKKSNEYVYPVFFVSDYRYTSKEFPVKLLLKKQKPTISFCGCIFTFSKRLEWLEFFKKSKLINCNFIYRSSF